jgi:hypothetical protein
MDGFTILDEKIKLKELMDGFTTLDEKIKIKKNPFHFFSYTSNLRSSKMRSLYFIGVSFNHHELGAGVGRGAGWEKGPRYIRPQL